MMKSSSQIAKFLTLGFLFSVLSCDEPKVTQLELHNAIDQSFNSQGAMEVVNYLSDRWRLRGGGNDGYNESIDYVYQYLRKNDFEKIGKLAILEGPLTLKPLAWNVASASLSLGQNSFSEITNLEINPTLVAKYSGATPIEGVQAEIIDIGAGDSEEDYLNKNIKGKIIIARAPAETVFSLGIEKYGAIGAISDRLSRDEYYDRFPDMVLHEALPFDEKEDVDNRDSWMLKVSPKIGDSIRNVLAKKVVQAIVKIDAKFFESTQRTLVAEIQGESKERVVLVAHIDNNKPGANNNASGIAAHAELARIMAKRMESDEIPSPKRTITFLFGAEREGSKQWLQSLGEEQNQVQVMINADMAGEKAITGGRYLIEKSPEPTMHLQRSEEYTIDSDLHSGWGFRPVDIDPYPGHFINDYFWNVAQFRARQSGLVLRKHPFEGGSDHDVFLPLKIPSVLSWHWPDYFISTNMDTPDKVDSNEIKNTAIIHGMSSLELAMGSTEAATELLNYIEKEAHDRIQSEYDMIERFFNENSSSAINEFDREIELLNRWTQWYKECAQSVKDFPVQSDKALSDRVDLVVRNIEEKSGNFKKLLIEKWGK